MLKEKKDQKIDVIARRLRISGDTTRIRILCYIFSEKKPCVSAISTGLNLRVASVSHHLQVLAKEGLLIPQREGKRICYALAKNNFVTDLKKFVCKYK